MADICLELDDTLIARLETVAQREDVTLEDLLRRVIEENTPRPMIPSPPLSQAVGDEPIVKAAEIETAHRALNYTLGWRFMTCPQRNMQSAKLLLVTLNPGGREVNGPAWSQEAGSAYRIESWNGLPEGQAKLQRQMQHLFSMLGVADDEVFSANYVPFRSPTWADLQRKSEALAFSEQLWRNLKPRLQFDRVVCIGKDRPGKFIAALFGARLEASLPVGWGTIAADRYRLPDGRSLVALPHLSRFTIFGRPEGTKALARLFER